MIKNNRILKVFIILIIMIMVSINTYSIVYAAPSLEELKKDAINVWEEVGMDRTS